MNRLSGLHPDTAARRFRMRRGLLTLAGASMILVACGTGSGDDVPEDRQFANDPAPTRQATEIPTETATQPVVDEPVREVQATPAELLRTRGAPSTLYTVSGDGFVVLRTGDELSQSTIALPDGGEVLALAASPTGDRVGVVTRTGDGGPAQVVFFDEDGDVIGGPYGAVPSGTPGASPMASPGATPVGTPEATPESDIDVNVVSVSWAPQGNGVLVVEDGALVYVDVERGAEAIATDGVEGTILDAKASPTGGQILVHAVGDDGAHRAYLIQMETGRIDELLALRTEPGTALAELSWLPGGNGVVFVRGDLVDGLVMRGQLFSYEFRNDAPRLVATSGQGGPSGTIRNVALSADGRSVAYEVAIYDVDHWSLHSMWVQSLKAGVQELQLPVDSGHTVNGMAWSSEGLVWTYTARYGDEGDFVGLVRPDGEVQEIVAVGAGDATPVASPVTGASPVASPMATPVGTPIATPDATPVG